LHQRVF